MLLTSFSINSMSSLLSPISLITAFPLFFCFVISFPLLGFLSSSFFLWCLLTASAYVIEMLEGFSTSLLSHMLNYIFLLSCYTLVLPLPTIVIGILCPTLTAPCFPSTTTCLMSKLLASVRSQRGMGIRLNPESLIPYCHTDQQTPSFNMWLGPPLRACSHLLSGLLAT